MLLDRIGAVMGKPLVADPTETAAEPVSYDDLDMADE
jgi:hypothetical protein